jgi:hypothetical protein
VVLIDVRRPVHPGLLFFGLLVGNLRRPRYLRITPDLTIDVAIGSITGSGFLYGDSVQVNGLESGVVLGVVGDKICVRTTQSIGLYKRSVLQLDGRKNWVPKQFRSRADVPMVVDANPSLCRAFGFGPDDVVQHRFLGRGSVAGFANGTIWFQFESIGNRICRSKETSLAAIHSIITIVSTSRNVKKVVCSDNVEYPIEPFEPFNVMCEASYGEAIGALGAFYCVSDFFDKKYKLVAKKICRPTKDYGDFRQFDVVKTDRGVGAIVDCHSTSVFVLADASLLRNESPFMIESEISLIFRVVGRGKRKIGADEFEVGACSFSDSYAMPGDLFATRGGFVRIVGLKDGVVMCSDSLDLGETPEVVSFDDRREGAILVSRRVLPATRVCRLKQSGSIEVSLFVDSFAGLHFLPGDEILIDGEHYIVFGNKGGYLWIEKLGMRGVCYFNPAPYVNVPQKAELFMRPTSHYEVFLG